MEDNLYRFARPPITLGAYPKKKLMILIPCYNELDYLVEHLRALSGQSFLEFDALVVLSNILDNREVAKKLPQPLPFNVILLNRASDTGSSGGFYAGEKYALENGYECVIFADVDAIPSADKDLVEMLWKSYAGGAQLAQSYIKYRLGDKMVFEAKPGSNHCYGMISTALIRKAGLHYYPLYIGADDTEYLLRTSSLAPVAFVDRAVYHPLLASAYKNFDRDVGYIINHMLIGIPRYWLGHVYTLSTMSLIFLLFGEPHMRESALHILKSALTYRFGRENTGFSSGFREKVQAVDRASFDTVVSPIEIPGVKELILHNYGGGEGKRFGDALSTALKVLRKRTLFSQANMTAIVAGMPFAKECWVVQGDGKALLVSDNRSLSIHVLKGALFCFLFPSFLTFSFISLAVNLLRKPDTMRFGL
ncbi:MAG: glycosyltransferase [Candidatus Micrarchaeota archaeon]